MRTIFQIPSGAFVYQLDSSPDGEQLIIAYTEPADGEANPFDRSGLYLLDLSLTTPMPERLIGAKQANVYFYDPAWSSDGNFIYYVRLERLEEGGQVDQVWIERFELETGETIRLAENSTWPRTAHHSNQITYVAIDPENGVRSVILADPDGSNAQDLISAGAFNDLDLPFFAPDDRQIYFSVLDVESSRNWLDIVMG